MATLLIALACGQAPAVPLAETATAAPLTTAPSPSPGSSAPILIGTEYVLLDNPGRLSSVAELLAPIGLHMAKPLPEHITWGRMQPSADAAVDFSRLDDFVRAFQSAGFTDFLLALKTDSPWGSKDFPRLLSANPTPKPQYMQAYERWIAGVVERYDADGADDMPGLLGPIRYYEIGSEFSSYEPEPVADYLEMLEHAYAAAHAASEEVIVTHAAFLTTLAFAPMRSRTSLAGWIGKWTSAATTSGSS